MIVKEIMSYDAKFTEQEKADIDLVAGHLQVLLNEMQDRGCDTFECCGEYTFDISDLEQVIELLEMVQNLTQISA